MLYDAGQVGTPVGAVRSTSGYLWSRGITHIDAIVLSHGDMDHFNALPGLLDRFSVGAIYVTPVMFESHVMSEDQKPAIAALREAIERHKVPLREVTAGDRIAVGPDGSMEVLHPPRGGALVGDNPNCLVLAVEYEGHRILLTGDLESPGLEHVLAKQPTPCDVLLIPHHGSRQGKPAALAAWCTPRWAVISGSHRWDPRPVETVYERGGSQVFHTADCGAVTATVDANGVQVSGFR